MTNGDKIRSMTDEELVGCLNNEYYFMACDECDYRNGSCDGKHCEETILKWLRTEVK